MKLINYIEKNYSGEKRLYLIDYLADCADNFFRENDITYKNTKTKYEYTLLYDVIRKIDENSKNREELVALWTEIKNRKENARQDYYINDDRLIDRKIYKVVVRNKNENITKIETFETYKEADAWAANAEVWSASVFRHDKLCKKYIEKKEQKEYWYNVYDANDNLINICDTAKEVAAITGISKSAVISAMQQTRRTRRGYMIKRIRNRLYY